MREGLALVAPRMGHNPRAAGVGRASGASAFRAAGRGYVERRAALVLAPLGPAGPFGPGLGGLWGGGQSPGAGSADLLAPPGEPAETGRQG